MKWQGIAPVNSVGTSSGIVKYSARQQGYAGSGRHQPDGYSPNPRKPEDGDAKDKFLSSDPEKMTEFQSLLKKLTEDNEKMKKVAQRLIPGTPNGKLYIGAQTFGYREYALNEK